MAFILPGSPGQFPTRHLSTVRGALQYGVKFGSRLTICREQRSGASEVTHQPQAARLMREGRAPMRLERVLRHIPAASSRINMAV
jgi:hypothetical protein